MLDDATLLCGEHFKAFQTARKKSANSAAIPREIERAA